MHKRARARLWGEGPHRAIVTVVVAATLVVVFVFERLSGSWQHDVTNLRHAWGWSLLAMHEGDWWRLVTPAFLHSDTPSPIGPLGLGHLLANLFTLAVFAPRVERRHGHVVVAGAFVALHVAAFSMWALTQTEGGYFGVGASGATVGLAATAVVDALRSREWAYAAGSLAFGVWWWWPDGFTSSDQVHLGGAVAGTAFGLAAAWPSVALATIAIVGVVLSALGDPRLPPRPRSLPCPDAGYEMPELREARLFLRNRRTQSVDVYWVRPGGRRDALATLRSGDHLIEDSWAGARFVVTTDRGRCLQVVEVGTNAR